jgi:sn-glycerol 3-phosphate transport system substrate-binding protein
MRIRDGIAALAAWGVLAAAGSAGAQTTVTFWHSLGGVGEKAINEMAGRFNASQTAVKVEPTFVGSYVEGMTRLQAAIPANRAPDIMMLEITRYGLFAERGLLEPLEPYLAASPEATANIMPYALDAAKYKGKSYVLPLNTSTPLMYYNRDMFRAAGLDPDKPPRTWDEMLAAARTLTLREGDRTRQWGINTPPQWVRWAMTRQNGSEWVDTDDGKVLIDTPSSIEAYKFAADWIHVHKVASQEAGTREAIGVQYFTSGQAAIHFDSTGSMGNLARAVKFDMGVAHLPCRVTCAAPLGGAAIGIMSTAAKPRKDAAWRFIAFMMRADQNATVFVETGYLPINKLTQEHPVAKAHLAANPMWNTAVTQLPVAFTRARPPAMPRIRDREEEVWQSIVIGQKPAEQALRDFGREVREMMAAGG